jgi:hypothetical protein
MHVYGALMWQTAAELVPRIFQTPCRYCLLDVACEGLCMSRTTCSILSCPVRCRCSHDAKWRMAVAYNMFMQLLFTIRHAEGGNLGPEMFGSFLYVAARCLQARKLWKYVAW